MKTYNLQCKGRVLLGNIFLWFQKNVTFHKYIFSIYISKYINTYSTPFKSPKCLLKYGIHEQWFLEYHLHLEPHKFSICWKTHKTMSYFQLCFDIHIYCDLKHIISVRADTNFYLCFSFFFHFFFYKMTTLWALLMSIVLCKLHSYEWPLFVLSSLE